MSNYSDKIISEAYIGALYEGIKISIFGGNDGSNTATIMLNRFKAASNLLSKIANDWVPTAKSASLTAPTLSRKLLDATQKVKNSYSQLCYCCDKDMIYVLRHAEFMMFLDELKTDLEHANNLYYELKDKLG